MLRHLLMAGLAVALIACEKDAPGIDTADRPKAKTERNVAPPQTQTPGDMTMDAELAGRFAQLALDCVHREYPNKIAHVLNKDSDAKPPKELHPAFYGCFDWHSSVHGHWLLVRLLHLDMLKGDQKRAAMAALSQSFTRRNMAGELEYFQEPGRASYERPYGTAWFLQLVMELEEWDDPQAKKWRETLRPLEEEIVASTKDWLPKLAYPIRLGTHNQSAFAFTLMLDYARTVGDDELEAMLTEKTLEFHKDDVNCPLAYEPSGEDFLSPCLMEADLMRRVMPRAEYRRWLGGFMPDIPKDGSGDWLEPGIVRDASDGKLVHLDGVNLSRAWNLRNIARAVGPNDSRYDALMAAADLHEEVGVAAVSDEHYSGSHWLASFATYLTTSR